MQQNNKVSIYKRGKNMINEEKKVKYLIIGAGISGLSFANELDNNNYIIVEKENEVGGFCRTIKKGE